MTHKTFAAFVVACSLIGGCIDDAADDEADPELSQDSQDIIGGYATFTHPDVGYLVVGNAYCTATLIAPRLVLTAAHCVGYRTKYTTSRSGTFTIELSKTSRHVYHTTRYSSYDVASGGYKNDLAVVQLETAVPASVAAPYHVGHTYPAANALIAIYGYGDTNPFSQTGSGTKRRWNGHWNGTLAPYLNAIDFVIAEGDSGGPLMSAATGIIGVSSRYYYNTDKSEYYDYFAYVVPAYPWIIALERAWG